MRADGGSGFIKARRREVRWIVLELLKAPKASGRPQEIRCREIRPQGRDAFGHAALPLHQRLAAAKPTLKAIAKKLREQGKDATVTAVVREITQGDKKQRLP
jgi:hypothetical protein